MAQNTRSRPANRARTFKAPANAFTPGHSVGAATRFTKGVSGNPSGRGTLGPKVAELVDHYCGACGARLIEAFTVVALGSDADRLRFFGERFRVNARDRLHALDALADRRWGRAAMAVELTDRSAELPVEIVNVFSAPESRQAEGD